MARNKLSASETQKLNVGACRILMARLEQTIERHDSNTDPDYGDCGDTRNMAEQLAVLVRTAEGVDVGDDYGREILEALGL